VSDTNLGKLFEAGTLLVGLVVFAWWQLRDLRKAKDKSAAAKNEPTTSDKKDPSPPTP
jgi:hypothetical protein